VGMFLYTNVLIGFIFACDPWHGYTENLFNEGHDYYWSNNVELETNKIMKLNKDNYFSFFYKLLDKLENEEIINKEQFIKIAKNINPKDKINNERICQMIWENGGWYEDTFSQEITISVENILSNLSPSIYENFKICKNYLNEPCNENIDGKYKNILNNLRSVSIKNNLKIHFPDDIILIDAHHLAKKNLIRKFVTADLKLLRFEEFIIKYTDIPELVYLKKFNFN
jgi:hypothetical protein